MKPLAETNQLLVDGKITNEEYHTRINLLNDGPQQEAVQAEVVESKILPEGGDTHHSYCASCGTQLTKDLKFCGNCGTAVAAK